MNIVEAVAQKRDVASVSSRIQLAAPAPVSRCFGGSTPRADYARQIRQQQPSLPPDRTTNRTEQQQLHENDIDHSSTSKHLQHHRTIEQTKGCAAPRLSLLSLSNSILLGAKIVPTNNMENYQKLEKIGEGEFGPSPCSRYLHALLCACYGDIPTPLSSRTRKHECSHTNKTRTRHLRRGLQGQGPPSQQPHCRAQKDPSRSRRRRRPLDRHPRNLPPQRNERREHRAPLQHCPRRRPQTLPRL